MLLSTAALATETATSQNTPDSQHATDPAPSSASDGNTPSGGDDAKETSTTPPKESTDTTPEAPSGPTQEGQKEELESSDNQTGQEPETPPVTDAFARFTDATSHWASAALRSAWEEGFIQGFEDNTMRPNSSITGAQMVTMLTRILHATQSGSLAGTGVSDSAWYRDAASKAVALGILHSGNASSLTKSLSRLQACAMLSDAFQLEEGNPSATKAAAYSDFSSQSKFDKNMIATLVNQGLIQGWGGSLHLDEGITRAEFVTILYRILPNYETIEEAGDLSDLTENTLLSAEELRLKDVKLTAGLWLDCSNTTVALEKVTAPNLTIRGDTLSSFTLKDSHLTRLVLAARSGDVKLNLNEKSTVDTIVVGDGGGKVTMALNQNDVEITGSNRTVTINGNVGTLSVSGDNNTVTVAPQTNISTLNITGRNNALTVGSAVFNLTLDGRKNAVSGDGLVRALTWNSATSTCDLSYEALSDNRDYGVTGMAAAITAPSTLPVNTPLQATAAFTNPVIGKKVTVTWTVDSKPVKTEDLTLSANATSQMSHTYTYSKDLAAASQIGFVITYVTYDEDTQTISAPVVTVNLENYSAEYYDARDADKILAKVTTYYSGNYTTQWAVNHDLADYEKEIFVNTKGYSSSSQYLIWVNIGTQHTSIFQGSQGNWKLIRSGLVSTGANDATPRGVFKTLYKQKGWFTKTYDVRPVVHFRSGGFAFHSRLYNPGTNKLWTNSNGVGYPLSHGCVRMEQDDIQWLYDNVPNGTTVVVY